MIFYKTVEYIYSIPTINTPFKFLKVSLDQISGDWTLKKNFMRSKIFVINLKCYNKRCTKILALYLIANRFLKLNVDGAVRNCNVIPLTSSKTCYLCWCKESILLYKDFWSYFLLKKRSCFVDNVILKHDRCNTFNKIKF